MCDLLPMRNFTGIFMCMYVCMYVCVYIYIYLFIYLYIYLFISYSDLCLLTVGVEGYFFT